ncbi:MAG: DNA replication/repair protein RecF [Anaerolineae bacterium]|nr:DNA replication/repair protein RecF [Anaerolineae bacterium]
MRIRYLSLTNFRNYARLELTLPEEPLLLYGGNAQGKTSLLEAIYLLATGSSPLTGSDRELIRWQAEAEGLPYARIWAEIERGGGTMELEIALEKRTLTNGTERLQKTVRIDRARKRQSSLSEKLNVVLFTPQHVDLVAGSPSGRRRYMNDALSQVNEAYSEALNRYTKALRQRNAALRHVRDQGGNPAQLEPFERVLARNGVTIASQRRAFLDDLSVRVKRIHERLTGDGEWLRLDYDPNFDPSTPPALKAQVGMDLRNEERLAQTFSVEQLVDIYQRALLERRSEEIARGVTVFGPHRDDIRFIAGSPALGTHEVDLGTYGSRGQQRTAVLSLKLAELRWMNKQTQENPVLLLDEVLAELDRTRRAYLLEHINGVEQAILTATDPEMFSAPFLEQAVTWEVRGGLIHPEGPREAS